jgi:hypothetical protein
VVGGAVKAGPSGPPGGGALRAPGVQLSPATLGSDRPLGGPGCSGGGWAQRTSPLLNILSGATEMLGDRPFLRDVVRMVCSGHSQNGLTQIDGHATRGATAFLELASWLVRACSSGLP